jgi:hypothetical protein
MVYRLRALELGEPVAEILARGARVMASAMAFDPATSGSRFMIGAPDAVIGLGDGSPAGTPRHESAPARHRADLFDAG